MKNRKKNKKRLISDILLLLCALLLLYPFTADLVGIIYNTQMYAAYTASVEAMSEVDYDAVLEAARAYNKSLSTRGWDRFSMTDDEREEYLTLLSLPDTDVMAYISIEKLGIEYLPVYHTTESNVMQSGVGHYEGSSLPVGGESTHAVLSSHTGLAGNRLFTDLGSLEPGDTFTIYVLGEVLTYQVDQIVTVLPDDVSYLGIEEGEDYCTLVTCTPIGLNTHRLLVRGTRIATPEGGSVSEGTSSKKTLFDRIKSVFNMFALYEWFMLLIACLIIFIFLVPDIVRYFKRKRGRRLEE